MTANRMIRYSTMFESTKNLVKCISLGHGENADLITGVTNYGVPVCLEGYTVQAIFQPESAWGTEVFYEVPSEISGDVAVIHWSHTQDIGENAVKIWVNFSKDGEVSYPAMYQLSLYATPGFNPSVLENIPRVIDCSKFTFLNAPWVVPADLADYATKAELNGKADIVSSATAGDFAGLDANGNLTDSGKKASDFLAITGGTLTGDVTVSGHDLIRTGTKSETYKNLIMTNDTTLYFSDNPILIFDEKYMGYLLSTDSSDIPVTIRGTHSGLASDYAAYLTNPTEYIIDNTLYGIKWDIIELGGEGLTIGVIIFRELNGIVFTSDADIYEDTMIGSHYGEDTIIQNVPFSKNYIYDLSEVEGSILLLKTRADILEVNKEDKENKVTAFGAHPTDTQYPSAKCVNDALALKEVASNKVTSISSQSTDAQYPSAKCVYDLIGDVETLINAI